MNSLSVFAFYATLLTLILRVHAGEMLADSETQMCAFAYPKVKYMAVLHPDDEEGGEDREHVYEGLLDDPTQKVKQCSKATDFCYAFWYTEIKENKTVVTILAQDCWESSGRYDCHHNKCIAEPKPSNNMNSIAINKNFCCCAGPLCNLNFTDSYLPETTEESFIPATQLLDHSERNNKKIIVIFVVISVFVCIVIGLSCWLYRIYNHTLKPPGHVDHPPENPFFSTYSLDSLVIGEVIGHGRYGRVCLAKLNDQTVAVKVFPGHHRQYFINEREIYCLPFMENPALLQYFGSKEAVNSDGYPECLLVMSCAPNGSLMQCLKDRPIDWPTFCKMNLSIVRGLAHLHTGIRKGDLNKPSISHRDLNTKNILVKADLSCCLCDLGFAMQVAGSKYFVNGEEQQADTEAISDVGTLRYMAPEVLDGAVNLHDCETSLKQIDIYALGLVMWEVASRCTDLYQGLEVPQHKLPFQNEIGKHPTLEQLQVLVSHNKARPLFPEVWKDTNPAIRLLKESIEDCWDQDADARLTVLCVEERLQEMPILWDRHKAPGMSPTVNLTHCLTNRASNSIYCNSEVKINLEFSSGTDSDQERRSNIGDQDNTASESTVETTVTMSPTDNSHFDFRGKNSQVTVVHKALPLLQPHQGRNPCLERNLIREPPCEFDCLGNELVEKVLVSPPSEPHARLLSNDFLNITTRSPISQPSPIAYVQNPVHETIPKMQKQMNLPGNGQRQTPKLSWWKRLLRQKTKIPPDNAPLEVCLRGEKTITRTHQCKGRCEQCMPLMEKERKERPSSLKIEGWSSLEGARDVFGSHGGLKDPQSHVQTPYGTKRNCLSLYDDSMMLNSSIHSNVSTTAEPTAWRSASVILFDSNVSHF